LLGRASTGGAGLRPAKKGFEFVVHRNDATNH
jgi:hypothetical protein